MLDVFGVLVGAGLVLVGVEFTSAVLGLTREDSAVVRVVAVFLCLYGACIAGAGALLMWASANA